MKTESAFLRPFSGLSPAIRTSASTAVHPVSTDGSTKSICPSIVPPTSLHFSTNLSQPPFINTGYLCPYALSAYRFPNIGFTDERLSFHPVHWLFPSIPGYSSLVFTIPFYSRLFSSISVCSLLFPSVPFYSHPFSSIPIYSRIFPSNPAHSRLFPSVPVHPFFSKCLR